MEGGGAIRGVAALILYLTAQWGVSVVTLCPKGSALSTS